MRLPLQGKKILVTRAKEQGEIFTKQLENSGAEVIHIPLLTFQMHLADKNKLLQKIKDNRWIFFTSANGVIYFFKQLERYHIDNQLLDNVKFAVVGNKTKQMLQSYGYQAAFYPSFYHGKAMAEEFIKQFGLKESILLVVGNRSRLDVKDVFKANKVYIDYLTVYDTIVNRDNQTALINLIENDEIDGYTFTSPSTVHAFNLQLKSVQTNLSKIKKQRLCVCIGTTTAIVAKENGFEKVRTPKEFNIENMISEMIVFFLKEREGEKL